MKRIATKFAERDGYKMRDLGWRISRGGKRQQQRFVLLGDHRTAERAVVLLEMLWNVVVAQNKRSNERFVIEGVQPTLPLWDDETLWIAKCIARGQTQIEVPYYPIRVQLAWPGRRAGFAAGQLQTVNE